MKLFKHKLSVIMPAYNEGHHIYENIKETHRVLRRARCGYEVILVDDGSRDNTYEEARRAAAELGCTVPVSVPENRGKGNALKEGFNHASGDFVIFLDADLDLHPEQLHRVLRVMRDERADVIVGSKYNPDSRLEYPFSRKVMSKVYALVLKVLFDLPLRDTQTGLKAFRKEVLEKVFPLVHTSGFAFDIELLSNAHGLGYRVVEAPVVIDNRREMKWGRITMKDMYRMWLDTMAIYYRQYMRRANFASADKGGRKKVKNAGKYGELSR